MIDAKTKSLLAKYDMPAPRYTSFPTAVQFEADFSPEIYAHALAALDKADPVSLYTHIPFCHSLCLYCGCNTTITPSYERIAKYVDVLLAEIALVGENLPGRLPAGRLHFGGGSPNYASTADLARILTAYDQAFDLSHMQIDMECDPRLLTDSKIKEYAALGVSRISLGIQDFNAAVQAAVKREQPFQMVADQVDTMRRAGIEDINFDLIIGLPEQSPQTVEETLAHVKALRPSRIAVFPYAHVPWMKKHQQVLEAYPMPDTDTRFEMAALVHETLCDAGYESIGIDHYALPEDTLAVAARSHTMQRNFQGYTDDPAQTILGFGQSSISQVPGAYIQNSADAGIYRRAISAGKLASTRGLVLTEEDKARRALIEQVMCYFEVDFAEHPDVPVPHDRLALLAQDGLIEVDEAGLHITETGRPFTRIVAACFDPYFKAQPGRHAKAI